MIIVCPNEIKNKYLMTNKIHNNKFFDLKTLKEKVYFKYHDLALYETVKYLNVIPSIAANMLDNLYYISEIYEDSKLQKLYNLKTHLQEKEMLIFDPNFRQSLNEEILIEGYPIDLELEKIINILKQYTKVTIKPIEKSFSLKEIYEFDTAEAEIRFIAENILELLNKNIDINKIVVTNFSDEYIPKIYRVFSLFKIPFNLNKRINLTTFKITKEFLAEIKTSNLMVKELDHLLKELNDKYHDQENVNLITAVLNKYYCVTDAISNFYDVIYYELSKITIKPAKYKNVVNIESSLGFYDDDTYVFAISNNEGVNPHIYRDDEYLKDVQKSLLGLSTSFDKTRILEEYILIKLSKIKNLTLSYKLRCDDNKYVISSILENLEVKKYEFRNNSFNYNRYLYENVKPYNNQYNGIDINDLVSFIDNKLNLSYSSMDQFFKCQFRFFLNNILKIEPNEETMATKIGSMFHKILERTLKNNFEDYLQIIDEETTFFLNSDLKEQFYGQKLKKEVIKLIERLKEREKITDFKNAYFEQYLTVDVDSKINIKVVGFTDKILLFNDSVSNYVVVVDYKTGSVSTDLTKIKDGFNMQLLMYLYLIKNTTLIKNPRLAGAYIEHILDELKNAEIGKSYAEIEKSNNRLEGLTLKDQNILKHFDHNYETSSYIKGIKLKKDLEFYNYSRVYDESEFDILLKYIDENIKTVVKAIEQGDFKINPKRYITAKPSDIIGCEFCPFKEICYVSAKDVVILNETTMEEIMGEKNEVD